MHFIWPWQDRSGRFSFLKAGAFALMLGPAVRTVYLFAAGDYGAPAASLGGLTYWSGVWATVVLLMALAVTPAAKMLRYPPLVDVRRMVGVSALVYTLAHMAIYFALRGFDVPAIVKDMTTRLSLVLATLSTVGLIVLGSTSLDAAIRVMGAKNWQRLHTANYAISGLAILHVVLARGTYPDQYMLTAIFFWLMAWRLLARYGLGVDVKALAALTVAACLVAAFLEAGFLWGRRGFDIATTLGYNFTLAILEVGYPPAWQVLALGLLCVVATAGRSVVAPAPRMRARTPIGRSSPT